jgi:GDP-mannose pyrophosphatase NudK
VKKAERFMIGVTEQSLSLYNKIHNSVIFSRQFRLPTFVNGNDSRLFTEACTGFLETENRECIRQETEEETGFKVNVVRKIFEAYMSPRLSY